MVFPTRNIPLNRDKINLNQKKLKVFLTFVCSDEDIIEIALAVASGKVIYKRNYSTLG